MERLAILLFLRAARMHSEGCSQYCCNYTTPLPQTHTRNYYCFFHQICITCNIINPHVSDRLFSAVCDNCYMYTANANEYRRADAYNFTVHKLPTEYYIALLEELNEHYNIYGGPEL